MSKFKKFAAGALAAAALVGGSMLAATPAQAAIILFDAKHYDDHFPARNFGAGEVRYLSNYKFDNITSSLRVYDGHSARLFQYANYNGYGSTIFWTGSPDLSTWAFPTGGTWSNRASSVF